MPLRYNRTILQRKEAKREKPISFLDCADDQRRENPALKNDGRLRAVGQGLMNLMEQGLFAPKPNSLGRLIRILVYPLSAFYLLGLTLRSFAYRVGLVKSYQLSLPVISIGNLTLGGSGKTPTVIWLTKKLWDKGLRPAVSIRGYRSRAEKSLVLLQEKTDEDLDPRMIGDEACLLAQKLKAIPILVGKDRVRAGEKAEELKAQLLILDDGFQHLRLKRELDLVLIDARKSLSSEKLFPSGRLREPLSSLKRAHLIIISRAEKSLEPLMAEIRKFNPFCPIFKMRYLVQEPESYAGKRAYAFAGIADPEYFFELAQNAKINLVGKKAFSDHHYYLSSELKEMEEQAKIKGAELLLTTEKDLARIKGFEPKIPLRALVIKPDFFEEEGKILEWVMNKLKLKEPKNDQSP